MSLVSRQREGWRASAARVSSRNAAWSQDPTDQCDRGGDVTAITNALETPSVSSFTYDPLDRLLSASGPYEEAYEYSEIGNLTAKAGVSYTYPDSGPASVRPHAVTSTGSSTYGYDANGNMVTRTVASGTFYLSYDPENRLLAVDRQEGEALARSAQFGYDGDGSRVLGVVTGTSAVRTVYVGAYYEWVEGSGARRYYAHAGKRIAMRDTAGALHWLLPDHLGSTSITADGDPVARSGELRYAPWGETRYEWGTTPTKRRFTGQIEEAQLGLYFYNARWYDASLGRFAQADTIVPEAGNPQNLNRFAYAANGPVVCSDPTGHAYTVESDGGSPFSGEWDKHWQIIWAATHGEQYLTSGQIAVLSQLNRYFGPLADQVGTSGGPDTLVASSAAKIWASTGAGQWEVTSQQTLDAGTAGQGFDTVVSRRFVPATVREGPDRTTTVIRGRQGGGAAITVGNTISYISDDAANDPALKAHEYYHVLGNRLAGSWAYNLEYALTHATYPQLRAQNHPLEVQGYAIQGIYSANPWLPHPSTIPWHLTAEQAGQRIFPPAP